MDITCPKCGASNRPTSRFCARCGEPLPRQEEQDSAGRQELDLPWLQAVQEKAVQPTTGLNPSTADEAAAEAQSRPSPPPTPAQPQPSEAPQPIQQAPPLTPAPPVQPIRPVEPLPRSQPQFPSEQRPAQPVEASPPSVAPVPVQSGSADEPPPPWVVGILEPSAPAPGPEQAYEPEELAHIMPWLHGKPPSPKPESGSIAPREPDNTTEMPDATEYGLPPWLGDVTVQETLQAVPPAEQRVPEPEDLRIEGIEPFIPPSETSARPEAETEELPDWLRSIGGAQPEPSREAAMQRATLVPSYETGETETLTGPPSRNVPVRPPRPGSVETLAALMQPATPESLRRVVTGPSAPAGQSAVASRRGIVRWLLPEGIIYLLVLAALLTVVIVRPPFGEVQAPASPGVLDFYNQIEAVPDGKPVLVVYDWDATRSAEMSMLSTAVMHHIMSRKLPFVTVSTVPQGPGFAQQITESLVSEASANYGYTYGKEYLILGYLPGNEAALRALIGNFSQTLPLDYVNSRRVDSYSLVGGGRIAGIDDFGLIVDLAASEAEMRNWIEQVASRTSVNVVAAVPQGLEPVARPFIGVPGARLEAVVSGTGGAAQYVRQLEQHGRPAHVLNRTVDLNTRLNAQSVAQILVALVIVSAFASLGVKRIFRRR